MTTSPLSVLSLYSGEPSTVQQGKKALRSGIRKQPVPEFWVDAAGVRGDHVLNRKHHGGPDQAAYLYTQPDAEAWAQKGLPSDLERAYWGENLRLSGLESADLRVGDRLHIGQENTVILEITAPRLPCALAAAYLADVYTGPFVKDFYALGRPGIYTRVLRPGRMRVNDPVTLERAGNDFPTLGELMSWHRGGTDQSALERALLAPLSYRMRQEVAEKLVKLSVKE